MSVELFVAPDWRCGIQPILYGNEKCKPNHSFGPTLRNYYLLHFVTSGRGIFHKGGKTYRVQSGDIFVIHPNEITIYATGADNPWSYIWLGFTSVSPLPFLDKAIVRHPAIHALFNQLVTTEDNPLPVSTIYALTHEILELLSAGTHFSNNSNGYAEAAKQILDASYTQSIEIQQISNALHIDRRYLSRLFREAYGITPKQYLTKLRLNQAQTFISQGYSISQAAEMAGFSDLSNFHKQYKAGYGLAPKESRTPKNRT